MKPLHPTPTAAVPCLLLFGLLSQDAAPEAEEERERGLLVHEDGAFEGYTLIAPLRSRNTYLIDMRGAIVHTWASEHSPTGSVYLLDDGSILRGAREEENPVFHGGGLGGRIERISWDGELLWDWRLSDELRCLHHDIEPLPNGNLLVIAWEWMAPEDAVAIGRDPRRVSPQGLWSDAVLEVRPEPPQAGTVVWEWHAWDHLVQDADADKPLFGSIAEHPGRIDVNGDHRGEPPPTAEELERRRAQRSEMVALGYVGGEDEDDADDERVDPDWFHTNSVEYDPVHDLVVLSIPEWSELWILDHSTTTEEAAADAGGRRGRGGEILWRWGNPRRYGAGGDTDQRLYYQHDPQVIAPELPGAGNLLVFNNGAGRPGSEFSSVEELELPLDPQRGFWRESGAAYGPAQPIWSYEAQEPESLFAAYISGAQRLPNGNTLICSGPQGRLLEVDRSGRTVWEYWNEHGGETTHSFGKAAGGTDTGVDAKATFRATRVARTHPGLAALAR